MKKLLTTIFAISTLFVIAQTPQGINYQSIIRTTGGIVIPNTAVNMEFKLYNGLAGALVYHETHTPTTNSFGMANLIIGQGSPISGAFNTITWSNGIAYEVYVNSVLIGTKQLFMSVPYALNAGSAPAPSVSFTNNILSVGGNTTTIPAGITYTAGSGIDLTGNIVTNTAPNQIVNVNGTGVTGSYPNYTVNASPPQTLSLTGNTLDISGGNSVFLPASTIYTAGNGINVTGNTISNSAPDQTVTLNAIGATTITGAYPTFTINTPISTSYTAGNGINVSGNTISNSAPDQTVTIAGVGNATVTGAYPNFTVNVPSGTNLPNGLNGQFLFNDGTIWDTLPRTNLYFDGTNFGIGTQSPGATFHVVGAGKFDASVTTNQIYTNNLNLTSFSSTGQVLTSDNAGNGTWQTLPALPTPTLNYNSGTSVLSLSQGTTVTTATLTGTGSNTISIVGNGLATVSPTTGSTFTVTVPNPTLSIGSGSISISGGNSVAIPSPSLTINSNSLTINGPGGNTVILPTTSTTTLTQGTNVTVVGSAPSYTVSAPGYSISLPGGNTVQITNGTSTSTAAIASTSLTLTGTNNAILSAGGNTVALNTYTAGTGISVTGTAPNYTLSSPNQSLTINSNSLSITGGNTITLPTSSTTTLTPGANIIVTGSAPNYTVASITPSLSVIGGSLSGSYPTQTLTIPTSSTTVLTASTNVIINGTAPNYTVSSPSQSLAIAGNSLSITGSNTITIPTSSVVAGNTNITVTPSGNTYSVSAVTPTLSVVGGTLTGAYPTQTLSIPTTSTTILTQSTGISVLGTAPNYTVLNTSPNITPTITGSGIASVTPVGNTFTVSVPSPSYLPGTGVLSFGTNTINVSPTLLLTGTTLTSGAATNTVNLSAINNWSVTSGVIYPATLTNSVGIGTSGPLTDKMEINHPSSTANTHLHLKQTGGDAFSRIKFTNAIAPSKYWLSTVTSAASDANSGYNFFYFNGTTGRNLFTVAGNGKVSVNPFSLSYPTLFEVNGGFELDSTIAVNGLSAMPPVSLINTGKIYFDRPNNKFKVSENGGAYVDLVGGGSSPWVQGVGVITQNFLGDKVGIGTAAPTAQLHVFGSTDPVQIAVENTGGAFKTGYKIKTNSQEWFIGKETGGSNALRFSDITSGQVRMAIETSGNVGIGTIVPTANLHVVNIGIVSPAGIFDITDPTNANNTIEVYNSGIGTSILATNTSSTNAAARFTNTGQGMALSVENTSNTDPTAYILNNGTAPALVVNGKTTITDGTQGLGKVLTSDASGNASWQPVTAPISAWTYNAGTIFPSNNFSTDKVGIGTNTPAYKLHIADAFSNNGGTSVEISATSASTGGANSAIYSDLLGSSSGNYISGYFRSEALAGATGSPLGVKGLSVGNNLTSATGVSGTAMNGNQNTGVYGSASGGTTNYGVFGEVSGPGYAGYFTGGPTLVDGKFVLWPQAAAPAAFIGQGSFYYDNTSNKIMVAENSTTYKPLFAAQPWVQGVGSVTLANITDNVGIGTTTPTSKLEVSGDLELGTGSYSSIKSHNDISQLGLYSSNTAYKGAYLNLNSAGHFDQPGSVFLTHGDYTAIAPASAMHFRYANNGAISTQMSILSSGRIGIGTTTPSAMLHVINTATTASSGRFENNSTANTADAVFVTNSGTGAAIHAVSGPTVAGSSNVALWLETGHLKATGATVTTGALNVAGGFIAPGIAPILTNCNDVKGTFSFTTSVTGIAAGAYIELQIIFAKPFITIPTVIATPVTDLQGLNYMVTATTTSSFYVRVYRTSNANITLPTTLTTGSMFKFNYMVIE